MSDSANHVARHNSELARRVAEFCRRDHVPPTSATRDSFPSSPLWRAVTATGTSVWLDTGDIDAIAGLWTREFTALTTNNSLLNKEVQKGLYDELVPSVAKLVREVAPGANPRTVVLETAFVLNAVHGLDLVRRFDADVSVELHTDLSHDSDASYEFGKRFAVIEPARFIVKVPLTPAGIIAARRLTDDGIRVNFTLGFSARQNYAIARLARPRWVNVFMGRLNSFVGDSELGSGDYVGERATLHSQRMLRQLRDRHDLDVLQIGASIRNGRQVIELCGVDVLTIPLAAARQFLDSAVDPDDVRDHSGDDPVVTIDDPIHRDKIAAFWNVDDATRQAVDRLADRDVGAMSAADLQAAFTAARSDLFPALAEDDRARIRAEGKLPLFATWRERVERGDASWDGLMSEAALGAFAVDQSALDERIRASL